MKAFFYLLCLLGFFSFSFAQNYNSFIVKFKNNNEINRFFSKNENAAQSSRLLQENKILKNNATLSAKSIEQLSEFEKIAILPKNIDLNKLKSEFQIEKIEPNYIFHIEQSISKPNDEKYSEQYALKNINAEFAWKKASGKGIVVGVIDTGIDFEHPDLINQLWLNSKEDINGNGKYDPWLSTQQVKGVFGDIDGIDNDGNGFVDDIIGFDFIDQKKANIGDFQNPDPIPFDEMGHGTMVSGIIAAEQNNKKGISGLAFNSKIMSIRTFDIMGNAESHNIASAILYAAINKAKVINCSWGDRYSSPIVYDAIKFAQQMGCVVVASSGNNGWDDPHYPSDYEGVISVGASDINNKRYGYSNYGDNLAFLAPGIDVLSTDFFGTYANKNGTSFSAPHVSALSALLLEINPKLSADEIKSIIAFSAKMPNTTDWNAYWGAGIIDAGEAVNNTPAMNISITNPINEEIIYRNSSKDLTVIGSVVLPLSSYSYDIFVGKGFNPIEWKKISTKYNDYISKDTLENIPMSNFDIDTNYTIRLVVTARNGKIVESRRRITVISPNTLKIVNVNIVQAWENGILQTFAGIITNMPSRVKVSYKSISDKLIESSDYTNFAYFHTIKINKPERQKGKFPATIEAILEDGTTTTRAITLELSDDYFPLENYNLKSYKLPPSYLFNGTSKFYDDNPSLIANDLTGGVFGKLYAYNFNPQTKSFEKKDSLNKTLVPVGYGDSNGDGINEVLFKASGTSTLMQKSGNSQSIFSNTLFQNQFGTFWAQDFYNIDKKGNDELICYSDTAYHIVSYKDNAYKVIANTDLPKKFKKIGSLPGLALGDFDSDGNNNIAFSNELGNLFVFNYKNAQPELQFIDSANYSKSSQYMCSLDYDGDGIKEIALLDFSTLPLFGIEEYGEPLWNIRIYKYDSQNNYKIIWSQYFYAVITGATRNGITIRNGLTSGDIDNDGKDELVVSIFPNIYSYGMNNDNTLKPKMLLKNTFTNNCLVYDFDKNGYKEIGFNDGGATYFAELNNPLETPESPLNFKGKLIDGNTIEFSWDKTSNAEFYQIYRAVLNGDHYDLFLVDETQSTEITVDTFKLNQTYLFLLVGINTTFKNQRSNFSDFLRVHTALPWNIKNINVKNTFLEVVFNGKLKAEPIETNIFYLTDESNKSIKPISVLPASDSLLIINFASIPKGKLKLYNEEFFDYWDNLVYKSTFIFENNSIEPLDTAMYLTILNFNSSKTGPINPYSFSVYFSEEPNISTMNINSFKLYSSVDENGLVQEFKIKSYEKEKGIFGIKFEIDKDQLIFASGKTYFFSCLNGNSIQNNPITKGAGNTLAFVITNEELNKTYIYPNPIKLSEGKSIYFANLPQRARIEVYNIQMNKIKDLTESDGNGGVKWDCTDEKGENLDTGIYFYKVIKITNNNDSEESDLKKFAIIK